MIVLNAKKVLSLTKNRKNGTFRLKYYNLLKQKGTTGRSSHSLPPIARPLFFKIETSGYEARLVKHELRAAEAGIRFINS